MKIQLKINVASLGILIAVATAIAVAGVLAIEELSSDLNRKLLSTELDNVVAHLADIQQILVESGVSSVPAYVESAQKEAVQDITSGNQRRFGHLSVVLSPSGSVIVHEDLEPGKHYDLECLPEIMKTPSGVTRCFYRGEEWLLFHKTFPEWNWVVILSASTREMLAMRTAFLRKVVLIIAISLIFGVALLIALTRGMVGPVQQLAKAAMGLSQGRFDTPLPKVRADDEVAELTRAFKFMSESLAVAHRDLERRTRELVAINEDLNIEVADRKKAEANLADLNHRLEQLVEERTRELARKAEELEIANQRLMELDEMKSSFLSAVSHELRTPLTSVLGFAKIIRKEFSRYFKTLSAGDEVLEEKSRRIEHNLEIIETEGVRLTRMINDVLDLNKIESGHLEWDDELLNPGDIVRRVVNFMSGLYSSKPGVELELDIRGNLPELRIDSDRLEQVLINLLNNAYKFTRQGVVTVVCLANGNGNLLIKVSDTGEGIPPEDLEGIFDKFYQGRQGFLQSGSQGAGLGLAISKNIVTHYGGRIWAESELGRGSTFHVVLPAVSPPQ